MPFSEQEDAEFAVVWLAVKRYDEGSMPRLRKPGGPDGRCPRCGGNLMSIVVLHGGRREHCPTCGFAHTSEPVPPELPMPEDGAEPTGRRDTIQMLLYAQAVLQTVRQARGCERCRERLALLRARIDDLEQVRMTYASQPEQCDDERLDAFFDLMTARLQGLGQLCRAWFRASIEMALPLCQAELFQLHRYLY